MKNKNHISPHSLLKEAGDGAISYAMYFIAIILVLLMYSYTTFTANLYVLESVVENGLHIIENELITVNQKEITEEGRIDVFERELKRMKIVTNSTLVDAWGPGEQEQVHKLGQKFQDIYIKRFDLINKTNPNSGILKQMCGEDADILLVKDVVIYEPEYEMRVERVGASPTIDYTQKYINKTWDFKTTYEIKGWIKYELHFSDNVYQGCTKIVCSETPKLHNNHEVEGATIEATTGIAFKGLKNIFANVSTTTPIINEKGEVDMSGVEGGLFSDNPEQATYKVQVTQAMDIVIADDDSRDINNKTTN